MKSQVEAVEKLHQEDLAHGYGEVYNSSPRIGLRL
jgi:hypothetical protein